MAATLPSTFARGVLAACLFSATGALAAPGAASVGAFADGASFFAPSISPDGRSIVYVSHVEGRRYVALRSLGAGGVSEGDRALLMGEAGSKGNYLVRYCWFKNDRRILCHYDGFEFDAGRPFATSRIVALDADGKNVKVLVQRGGAEKSQFQDRIVSRLPDDPTGVLIALDADGDVFPSVYRLDVDSGGLKLVVGQREPILAWIADQAGVVRFGYGYRGKKGLYLARDSASAEWRTLLRFERFDSDRFTPLGFGNLPNRLLVASSHRGRDAIWEMDLGDQKDLELVYAHPEVDVDEAYEFPGTNRLIGFSFETDRPQLQMIDAAAAGLQSAIDKLLPGAVNRMVDASANGRRIVILSTSDTQSGAWYLLDLDAASLRPLGAMYGALQGVSLATMRPVRIAGPGAVSMPGYLTLPVGRPERGLPAVVLPHGGPYARDSWGYDALVQLLASRGYAVLQVNYRGSTGYGSDWLDAGFQGWGTVMHDDITAAARWLVAEGIADPRRMCIVGWSYGGYAALIGAVKEPDLYRCAVSIAGVSDLRAIADEDARFYGGGAAARQSTGTEDLKVQSPRLRAGEIKVPVLLVHGHADISVVVDHSKAMAEALERAGKPHELLVIKNGDHSLRTPAMRLALYEKLAAFLAANLEAPSPAPASTAAATAGPGGVVAASRSH